ncbi:hypothetical protein [Undibacter mobilis]|nr:hypothetical protein [Undibacter mobilis]
MTTTKPERFAADKSADKAGPERFAPPPRAPERLGEIDQAAANAFEGEIREFVRRDVARRPRGETEPGGDVVADNLGMLIRRVSSQSMDEIDRVILELQGVRDMLRQEGDRVTREVAGYASLNHAAMTAMQVIGDSLKQWRGDPTRPPQGHRPAS